MDPWIMILRYNIVQETNDNFFSVMIAVNFVNKLKPSLLEMPQNWLFAINFFHNNLHPIMPEIASECLILLNISGGVCPRTPQAYLRTFGAQIPHQSVPPTFGKWPSTFKCNEHPVYVYIFVDFSYAVLMYNLQLKFSIGYF